MKSRHFCADFLNRVSRRLQAVYGNRAEEAKGLLLDTLRDWEPVRELSRGWDQTDAVLICYADSIRSNTQSPLQTLLHFLRDRQLARMISTIHLLPFFPYSSDDGFSVIDYEQVDAAAGTWHDVGALGGEFELMFDFVLNHISQRSEWFQKYLDGVAPYADYFLEVDPAEDLTQVVRPRSSPLLSKFETSSGPRHVWTTFSRDQVDLDYSNPMVLARMVEILLGYVSKGARVIRLDAVAFLWKRVGTACLHLPETHELIKLLRDLLEQVAPGVRLLTETNVPHAENISYFGNGDEAHMVYQFSLPPLLLDAFTHHDGRYFRQWLSKLAPPPPGTTFFNFTASHDGVGVRPLEGLLPNSRIGSLIDRMRSNGGLVSTRTQTDGSEAPYELNISYVSALGDQDVRLHATRFLSTQAVMLALRGIPGIYFHSLVGTTNDSQGAEKSGIARRINRKKYVMDELNSALESNELNSQIFTGYCQLLRIRAKQPAFHPDATQQVHDFGGKSVVAFSRTSVDQKQRILVLINFSGDAQTVALPNLEVARNLLHNAAETRRDTITLSPYETAWVEC